MSIDLKPKKAVYTIVNRVTGFSHVHEVGSFPNTKQIFIRIGWAKTNEDGSMSIELDALPVNGKLEVRDFTPGGPIPPIGDDR